MVGVLDRKKDDPFIALAPKTQQPPRRCQNTPVREVFETEGLVQLQGSFRAAGDRNHCLPKPNLLCVPRNGVIHHVVILREEE
jgi:hypothetical protein